MATSSGTRRPTLTRQDKVTIALCSLFGAAIAVLQAFGPIA